jgi:hypothetical protein
MFWQEAEPNDTYSIRRFVSTPTARWEIGIRIFHEEPYDQVKTHERPAACIAMALTGGKVELEYSCGKDDAEWYFYCGLIAGLCFFLPEDIDPRELRRIFPHQTISPLRNDRKCVEALFGLTDILQRYDSH